MSKGDLRVHISAVYPWTRMADAHQAMETKRTVGKIVIEH